MPTCPERSPLLSAQVNFNNMTDEEYALAASGDTARSVHPGAPFYAVGVVRVRFLEPLRTRAMRRRAYFLHRWLGLGAGALLLCIGLTGAITH